ncbi:MAG: DUF4908 domain-containing protein [Alphaproteobacteria bacterium]|nr:DUF4908 domain-containing protein [Alphaproteobacteria bacterium]
MNKRISNDPSRGARAFLGLASVWALATAAIPALAQQPAQRSEAPALSYSTSRANSGPPGSAKYEDTASQRSFVLDRSTGDALMKFDDSPEVYALRATTAQRGDAFLRSDAGELVLRVTELGNVISYLGDKDGAPADIAGAAAPLDAPAMPSSLTERVREAATRLARLAGHEVTIFGTGAFADDEAWAADALMVTVFGVERANGLAGKAAAKLKAVRLVRAPAPMATFADGELVLSVNPSEGYAGRPSSEAIASVLTAARRGT